MKYLAMSDRPVFLQIEEAEDVIKVDLSLSVTDIPDEAGVIIVRHIDRGSFVDTATRRLKLWRQSGFYCICSRLGWSTKEVEVFFMPCIPEAISGYRFDMKTSFQNSLNYIGKHRRVKNAKPNARSTWRIQPWHNSVPVRVFGQDYESVLEASVYIPTSTWSVRKHRDKPVILKKLSHIS